VNLLVFVIVDPEGGVQGKHVFLDAYKDVGMNRVEDRGLIFCFTHLINLIFYRQLRPKLEKILLMDD